MSVKYTFLPSQFPLSQSSPFPAFSYVLSAQLALFFRLQHLLEGRSLLAVEIGMHGDTLAWAVSQGWLREIPGIRLENGVAHCQRCGESSPKRLVPYSCVRCMKKCTYCRTCLQMGRVAVCTSLYEWTGPPSRWKDSSALHWGGELSPAQRRASDRVIEAVSNDQSLLVWAVCGSGKTEVLFRGIERALQQGKRVCIAAPRTDVILELAPRLQEVFPYIPVATLYGGAPNRFATSSLTLCTTHQLLRFSHAFDVIVVDEVDAFPYSVDATLQFAVRKALKTNTSPIVYLTATPPRYFQKACRQGVQPYVRIPARYHRNPLPEPTFVRCFSWRKAVEKGRLPTKALQWMNARLEQGRRVLLFFPNIHLMQKVEKGLLKHLPEATSVHAEDPARKEKVQALRVGDRRVLLTTTILERGVTIPFVDVAVIGGEHRQFTEAALVQIAGRAGRKKDDTMGQVCFFHNGVSLSMLRARHHIRSMNREALANGDLDFRGGPRP